VDDLGLPPKLADLLEPAARRIGLQSAAVGAVWRKWVEIVGEEVAAHAEPTSLRQGVLRVRADSPAWASELTYFGPEIRRRANEVAGALLVSEVRVWTGPGLARKAPTQVATAMSPADDDPTSRRSEEDPRSLLERAHQAWRRGRAKRSDDPSDAHE
jgi:predicted nucleic acid-binding Zn ribbon protein